MGAKQDRERSASPQERRGSVESIAPPSLKFTEGDPDFDLTFPKLTEVLNNLEKYAPYQQDKHHCGDKLAIAKMRKQNIENFMHRVQHKVLPLVTPEIQGIIPEWADLMKILDSHVCIHTLGVVYCTIKEPEFQKLPYKEQNILKWSALLHDIKKQGPPVFQGKDHLHPFNGGIAVLEIFKRLNYLALNAEQQTNFNRIVALLKDSTQPVHQRWSRLFKEGEVYCTKMHSHHHLSEIFGLLWGSSDPTMLGILGIAKHIEPVAPKGSFIDMVFRLVLFHQSFLGCDDYRNMVDLTPEERVLYCGDCCTSSANSDGHSIQEHVTTKAGGQEASAPRRFYGLIRILMLCDASSYVFVHEPYMMKHFKMQIFGHCQEYSEELDQYLKNR